MYATGYNKNIIQGQNLNFKKGLKKLLLLLSKISFFKMNITDEKVFQIITLDFGKFSKNVKATCFSKYSRQLLYVWDMHISRSVKVHSLNIEKKVI